ncbi:hypothetical protein MOF25_03525 [Bacillus atrophaeus]|uniref:hypothetical protein n=1 Tax=Bacillus atrophaeus TaxID=1452 RepID=UPI0022831570|nr:hypothetical protein [Bacillus atrophaeus]MCY8934980.1 hypothetical protein [Bacillus atrophaeus]MCY9159408.1 hypothetical protein [Bacillus atrophaeus]
MNMTLKNTLNSNEYVLVKQKDLRKTIAFIAEKDGYYWLGEFNKEEQITFITNAQLSELKSAEETLESIN